MVVKSAGVNGQSNEMKNILVRLLLLTIHTVWIETNPGTVSNGWPRSVSNKTT